MQICHKLIKHANCMATSSQVWTEKNSIVRIHANATSLINHQFALLSNWIKKGTSPHFWTYCSLKPHSSYLRIIKYMCIPTLKKWEVYSKLLENTHIHDEAYVRCIAPITIVYIQAWTYFVYTSPRLHRKHFWNLTGIRGRINYAQQIGCETMFI